MSKSVLLFMVVAVFLASSPVYSWEGRMSALGDPVGAIEDQSDFLVHPAKARDVEDLTLFTFFEFGYTSVSNYRFDLGGFEYSDAPGYEGAILSESGVLIPLGAGTLGVMFTFDHDWSYHDGDYLMEQLDVEVRSWDHFYGGSLLYAVDVADDMGVGFQVGLSYKNVVAEHEINERSGPYHSVNEYLFAPPYLVYPQDGAYGDASFAASLDGNIDKLSYSLTLNGGFYFSGYSSVKYYEYDGTDYYDLKHDANIGGWHIGGDVWLGYAIDESITIPFTFTVDYDYMTAINTGFAAEYENGVPDGDYYAIDGYQSSFSMGPAIGIDYQYSESLRLGALLSYTYAHRGMMVDMEYTDLITSAYISRDFSESSHTFAGNLNAEYVVADGVSLATGFNIYYSIMNLNMYTDIGTPQDLSGDLAGGRFGLDGSLGLVVDMDGFILEPYVSFGFDTTRLSGEDDRFDLDFEIEEDRWFVFTGVSLAYDGF